MTTLARVHFMDGRTYDTPFAESISARVYAVRVATDGFWLENTLILPSMIEKVEIITEEEA